MGRLIILIAIVVAAVWLLKRALRRFEARDTPRSSASEAEPKASQDLVRCARCGVLLPRGEARMAAGALYCSEEHARIGAKGG